VRVESVPKVEREKKVEKTGVNYDEESFW